MRRWYAIGSVGLVLGCGPQVEQENGQFGEGTGGTDGPPPAGSDSSTSDAEADDGDHQGSSGWGEEAVCPPADPNVAFAMTVEFEGDELPGEGGQLERDARCTVFSSEGGPRTWELLLDCDVEQGGTNVRYRIAFESDEDPITPWLDPAAPIDLQYRRWGSEAGAGQSLALSQDHYLYLLAHADRSGGGLVGVCAESTGYALNAAEEWLHKFEAGMNQRECIDGDTFFVGVPTRDGGARLDPGTQGKVDDVWFVYPAGQCSYTSGGAEDWSFSVLLWRR